MPLQGLINELNTKNQLAVEQNEPEGEEKWFIKPVVVFLYIGQLNSQKFPMENRPTEIQ